MPLLPASSGIYAIINTKNGKRYIGQSVDIRARWRRHTQELEAGRHGNSHLQHSWTKHGPCAFRCVVVVLCEPQELTSKEQSWVDKYDPDVLYNINIQCVESRKGVPQSPETKKRTSSAITAIYESPGGDAYRDRCSEGQKNFWRSPGGAEKKKALAKRNKAPVSDETRERLSASGKARYEGDVGEKRRREASQQRIGKKMPDGHGQSVSDSLKAFYKTPEGKESLGVRKAFNATPEGRARIERRADACRGQKRTAEQKERISQGRKAMWAKTAPERAEKRRQKVVAARRKRLDKLAEKYCEHPLTP